MFKGDANWRKINVPGGLTFKWDDRSTYVQNPPYFEGMEKRSQPIEDIVDARILGLFLDSITTDHISPAGSIKEESPAGEYLRDHQVRPKDFNQYGTRRGNHQVMMRGTFANIRIKNQMVPGVEGGFTIHYPSKERMTMYDAAMRYKSEHVPLVVFAGKEYGTGSSRDWAAKGSVLLGVRAVIAQSVRADPSLQPGRHGRGAAGIRRGRVVADARAEGRRAGHHPRLARRSQAAPTPASRDHRVRRRAQARAARLPHRYRSTSSNTTAMAAFCSTCCAISPLNRSASVAT